MLFLLLLLTSLFISLTFCSSCCLRACSSARRFALLVAYELAHQLGVFALLVVYELVHRLDVLLFLLFTGLFISLTFYPLAYELVHRLDASHLLAFEFFVRLFFLFAIFLFFIVRSNFCTSCCRFFRRRITKYLIAQQK